MADDPHGATIEAAARHYRVGDLLATERCCRAILVRQPRHFDALHLLGVVCVNTERHAEAIELLSLARAEQPRHPLLLFNLGNACQGLKRHQQAIEAFEQALAASPGAGNAGNVGVLNNLGTSLRALGRTEEAIRCFRDLLARRPEHAPAHNNLAGALADSGRVEEAVESYRLALRFAPADTPPDRLAGVVNGLGKALMDLGRHDEALDVCQALQSRYPELRVLEWNESLALLLRGEYAAGWRKYEARWHVPDHDPPHPHDRVLDLTQVAGQRILVTGEQGRGDIIQFARYVPLLTARSAVVTLSVYPDLVDLLRTLDGVAAVVSADDPAPEHDQRTPLLSLPLAFGTELATIPAEVPFLRAPLGRRNTWRERFLGQSGARIGLAWWGSQHIPIRSMPLATLAPLLAQPDVTFHALQKEWAPVDRQWLEHNGGVVDHSAALVDFGDTAALLEEMHLVITIDTAVAHLAGALGKPVWVMLPFNADWRWLLDRGDSPWYPTARLFRQRTRGDWAGVVQRVAAAMATFVGTREWASGDAVVPGLLPSCSPDPEIR